jgi:uncharacterized membrane protein YccC
MPKEDQAMATLEDRLTRWEQRQEALITAMNGLTDVMETTRAMLAELAAWLQQPPSNDLPDLIGALTAAFERLTDEVQNQGQQLAELPAMLARAVRDGEGQ